MLAVRGNPRLRVEDDRVDDVRLSGDPRRALLEHGVVVEQQRARGECRQVPRDRLAPTLHLLDDRGALTVLDDDHHRGHDEEQHEDCAQEELGLKRDEGGL